MLIFIRFYLIYFLLKTAVAIPLKKSRKRKSMFLKGKLLFIPSFLCSYKIFVSGTASAFHFVFCHQFCSQRTIFAAFPTVILAVNPNALQEQYPARPEPEKAKQEKYSESASAHQNYPSTMPTIKPIKGSPYITITALKMRFPAAPAPPNRLPLHRRDFFSFDIHFRFHHAGKCKLCIPRRLLFSEFFTIARSPFTSCTIPLIRVTTFLSLSLHPAFAEGRAQYMLKTHFITFLTLSHYTTKSS